MDPHQLHQSINDPILKEPKQMSSKYQLGDRVFFLVSTDVRMSVVISISHNRDYSEEGEYSYKLAGNDDWFSEDDLYTSFDQADNQR